MTKLLVNERKVNTVEMAQKPTEGKYFAVNPNTIPQKYFLEKREDRAQEWTRKIILEAFKKVKKEPKYAKPFKTMMPKKTWQIKKVIELIGLSQIMGDHTADWVEQALEWAQRIANGETWETICNEPDTANWTRIFIWKTGYPRLVGDSGMINSFLAPSDVLSYDLDLEDSLRMSVPNIVIYD